MFKFKTIDINKITFSKLLIVCLTIISIFSVRSCLVNTLELERQEENWKFRLSMAENAANNLKIQILEDSATLVTQQQQLVTAKEAKELALIENKALRNLSSEVKVRTVTKIKTVYVPFGKDSLVIDSVSLDKNDTVLTKPFRVLDEWYGISGKVLDKGILFDSVYFNNELTTTIGYKKDKGLKNIFKKAYPVVEVKNKNPYSNVIEMNNIIIVPRKKKFFETRGFQLGAAVIGGMYINNKLK